MRSAHGPRKKVKHYDLPGNAHYLTFSCYHGLPLLSKDRTRLWFLEALANAFLKGPRWADAGNIAPGNLCAVDVQPRVRRLSTCCECMCAR